MIRPSRSKYAQQKHYFTTEVARPDGSGNQMLRYPCKVIRGDRKINLAACEGDVVNAINAGGRGNAALCLMAFCVGRLSHLFPHPVIAPWITWTRSRLYVCCKVDKYGRPSECVAYEFGNAIAQRFDRDGPKAVIRDIQKLDGALPVTLLPFRNRPPSKEGGTGRRTGARRQPLFEQPPAVTRGIKRRVADFRSSLNLTGDGSSVVAPLNNTKEEAHG